MARAAAIIGAALATLAACYLATLAPVLNASRATIVSTPGLQGLDELSLVKLRAGSKACTQPVLLTPEMGRVRYIARGPNVSGDGVGVTLTGAGYRSRGKVVATPNAGLTTQLTAAFSPALNAGALPVAVCIKPTKEALTLVGTEEPRSLRNAQTKVDGKRTAVDVILTTLRPTDEPTRSVLGEIPARVSATTLGSVPTWIVWLLVGLAVLTATIVPIAALVWAERAESKPQ
jgi:hypothetical protein